MINSGTIIWAQTLGANLLFTLSNILEVLKQLARKEEKDRIGDKGMDTESVEHYFGRGRGCDEREVLQLKVDTMHAYNSWLLYC